MDRPSALIIDDDPGTRGMLGKFLERDGFRTVSGEDAATGIAALERGKGDVDIVFLDYELPDMNGIDALPKLKAVDAKVPIIMITGYGASDLAVRALHLGAHDFVEKPFELSRLRMAARNAIEYRQLRGRPGEESAQRDEFAGIITRSVHMQTVFDLVRRVRDLDATVLITGESGTGKELLARAVHDTSRRQNGPFMAINCAAIPSELLESELFGYEKGAFTGADKRKPGKVEQANGGTLFLDEIGDLSLALQAKLLRVLQEKAISTLGGRKETPVDVRFIAATHQEVKELVREGRFREDLYYRLTQFPIELPPLRARREDVVPLARHFLDRMAESEGIRVEDIQGGLLQVLEAYDWPGNIRELENVVRRAAILANGETMDFQHLPEWLLEQVDLPETEALHVPEAAACAPALIPEWQSAGEVWTLEEVEKAAIRRALEVCDGNVSDAAKRLGVARTTLYRKVEAYGLETG